MVKDSRTYRIRGVIDIEANTIRYGDSYAGIPYLFIVNTIECLSSYVVERDDNIVFFPTGEFVANHVKYHCTNEFIDVYLVHNLSYDWTFLSSYFHDLFNIDIIANGASSYIAFKLRDKKSNRIQAVILDSLRLFGGESLAKIGAQVGYEKMVGDLDYSKHFLFNELESQYGDKEFEYCRRDVRIPLLGVQKLLRDNEFITESMIGKQVLTSTSIIRAFIRSQDSYNYKRNYTYLQKVYRSPDVMLNMLATAQGALTFVNKSQAGIIHDDVLCIDSDSMHPSNMFITRLFYNYTQCSNSRAQHFIRNAFEGDFSKGILCKVVFTNLRLNSFFESIGGTISSHKLGRHEPVLASSQDVDTVGRVLNQELRNRGFFMDGEDIVHSFGKLEQASKLTIFCNEHTLHEISLVYDFDDFHVLSCFVSHASIPIPDYILDSVKFFYKGKTEVKNFLAVYDDFYFNNGDLSDSNIPDVFTSLYRARLLSKDVHPDELKNYYTKTIKGGLNGHFGIMFMKPLRGNITWVEGEGYRVSTDNVFTDQDIIKFIRSPSGLSFYNAGSAIAQKSRLELIKIIRFVHSNNLGLVLAGDTDSLYITNYSDDILSKINDNLTVSKNRKACEYLGFNANIGLFTVDCVYDKLINYWNKARVGLHDGRLSVIFAGLPARTIRDKLQFMLDNNQVSFDEIAYNYFGLNTEYDRSINDFRVRYIPSTITFDWTKDGYYVQLGTGLVPHSKILGSTGSVKEFDKVVTSADNLLIWKECEKHDNNMMRLEYHKIIDNKKGGLAFRFRP